MKTGFSGKVAEAFINSKLSPLLLVAFLAIGAYSVYLTPSEEEPQINVPIADIFIGYPGGSAKEVESRVIQPLEKIITNIQGVEYVYSTAMPGQAMFVVRYYVGEDVEQSLFRLYNEIQKNMDKIPYGVTPPLIKTKSIDDVPIIALTLWSENYDDYMLRRVAAELCYEIKQIEDVAETRIIGGRKRQIRVTLDKNKMAGYNVDPLIIMQQIQTANKQMESGAFNSNDQEFLVETGNFFESGDEVENLVVGVFQGNPVYLGDVAEIMDGPEEPGEYVSFGYGLASADMHSDLYGVEFPAVTISASKRKGTDAMRIARQILEKVENLKGTLIPSDIQVTITRDYGSTAAEKVNSLLMQLLGAIVAGTFVVALSMGWRGGFVVFMSVPVTFALTIFSYYMFGYTLNRITLFALILVSGIVIDSTIIVTENMHRHFKMRNMPFFQAAIASIDEIGNPTILATFTVIASMLPMAFVSGLMGPYMSPMPIGASVAMLFSMIVAFIISPWLAYRMLKNDHDPSGKKNEKKYRLEETKIYKIYVSIMNPLIEKPTVRWGFFIGTTILLLFSISLFFFKVVTVKMLPFDNKSEFQVMIDMPEGTTLERTAAATKDIASYLRSQPEVTHYQSYVGTSAPINFNGLVRHYDLRQLPNLGDIQVNILPKDERSDQSHTIAKRIRDRAQEIGKKYGANVKIAEVPPGPPVISTLVAEIYGPTTEDQIETAKKIKMIFENTAGVVDVDWYVEDDQVEYKFEIDKEKAMLTGVSPEQIVNALRVALHGMDASALFKPKELDAVMIHLRMPEKERSSLEDLKDLHVMSMTGNMVSISELVHVTEHIQDKSVYRKNQRRVVYVTGDVAGESESPIYAILDINKKIEELKEKGEMDIFYTRQPFMSDRNAMKWDGEWQITYEVFRDLGVSFAVVLIIIYMLIIGWFQSFKTPLLMMVAIPLSLVGIIVGHWIMGAFFTATSMIGMIALAGIMVRNSVLLIDFTELRLREGVPLKQAVIEAGAVRTTPILLTAGTVVIGTIVIILDPVFQGLAISLMGGSIVSTILTLIIVPLLYYISERKKYEKVAKV
ncbi:MAG: multidrug transporter AcrB [Candidatus Cloacimonetes bacterium 4572_55]|nr:MAG: multidrug transporter AcrB [Candidatus Cloacimonetes bacterium 4572_55]